MEFTSSQTSSLVATRAVSRPLAPGAGRAVRRFAARISILGAALLTVGGAFAASSASAEAAVRIWAKVSASGVLIAGAGVSSVQHFGAGRYDLFLPTNVNACAFTGTVNTTRIGDPGSGSASILIGQASPNILFVRTASPSAAPGSSQTVDDDRPFSVVIACN